MPVISILILVNSAYLGTKSIIIFDLKLLKSSIYVPRLSQMSALFYLALLSSQYISLSVCKRWWCVMSWHENWQVYAKYIARSRWDGLLFNLTHPLLSLFACLNSSIIQIISSTAAWHTIHFSDYRQYIQKGFKF